LSLKAARNSSPPALAIDRHKALACGAVSPEWCQSGSESELGQVLAAAFKGEIASSNPYRDFGTILAQADNDDASAGEEILDAMARFILTDAPAATAALTRLGAEMERATEEQAAALAAHEVDADDPNALRAALALADALAATWVAASDRLESLIDDDLIPSVLAIEKDVTSVIRGAAQNPDADLTDFVAGLAGIAGSTGDFVFSGITTLAATIRANPKPSPLRRASPSPGDSAAASPRPSAPARPAS